MKNECGGSGVAKSKPSRAAMMMLVFFVVFSSSILLLLLLFFVIELFAKSECMPETERVLLCHAYFRL